MANTAPPPRPLPEEVAALRQRIAQLEAALTAQQHGEQALRDAKDAAEQIVETVREPLLVLTPTSACSRPILPSTSCFRCARRRPKASSSISSAMGNGIFPRCIPCWKKFSDSPAFSGKNSSH